MLSRSSSWSDRGKSERGREAEPPKHDDILENMGKAGSELGDIGGGQTSDDFLERLGAFEEAFDNDPVMKAIVSEMQSNDMVVDPKENKATGLGEPLLTPSNRDEENPSHMSIDDVFPGGDPYAPTRSLLDAPTRGEDGLYPVPGNPYLALGDGNPKAPLCDPNCRRWAITGLGIVGLGLGAIFVALRATGASAI
uniref:Uncharacterized protein n=1 Tax=Phaeomonas parva TaxID=124430 RepID=A0A7S1Y139_9STRA|mmetsp:Transcript_8914/g.25886  ORF Transcript_8914/g.25886 Transcript_8914/m.25886 type:complete len:195 (+) Transcript_8914:114-698(+)|eukprot:CAMPEP_0118855180 /NCGR_PEP_ID=MMETSP1163-20130328/3089_1 /TAXON_ID=124430 /ORGANISM="Phaeomonas parva, Strain CCMP2877" /LENGTH=194 /DNA_ID=CAMNT_0006788025 /DNA_START=560 /DNA_END=1144 /DNA_ORIENTATION=+